jgi:hypothetical protein
MHRIRPHLGLTLYSLAGAAVGTGSVLFWRLILGPAALPQWAFGLIAGPSALLLLAFVAGVQHRVGNRQPRRRAHARTQPTTRKAT